MKILMLHGSHSGAGGAEIVVKRQAQKLAERGHEVLTFCFGNNNIDQDNLIVVKESTFIFFKYVSKFLIHIRGYLKMKKTIKYFRPDIIHLNNIDKYPLTFLLPIKNHKTIRSIHDFGIVCPTGWGAHRDNLEMCEQGIGLKCIRHGCIKLFFYPFYYYLFKIKQHLQKKRVHGYLVATQLLKEFMQHQGFKNISVSPYFATRNGNLSLLYPEKKILFVGALEKHKGCELLIRSFEIVIRKIPEATLVIVGSGTQEKKLKNLSQILDLESKISFAGEVPHKEIDRYYSQSAVVIVPSISMENSPLVIYEALSFGKPVIATKQGGNSELIIDGYNGFLVSANNTEEMAHTIVNILNKKNEKLYRTVSKNAFTSSQLYDLDKYIDKLEILYDKLYKQI